MQEHRLKPSIWKFADDFMLPMSALSVPRNKKRMEDQNVE